MTRYAIMQLANEHIIGSESFCEAYVTLTARRDYELYPSAHSYMYDDENLTPAMINLIAQREYDLLALHVVNSQMPDLRYDYDKFNELVTYVSAELRYAVEGEYKDSNLD